MIKSQPLGPLLIIKKYDRRFERDIAIQNGIIAKHDNILLRARHIEAHVEHLSLGHPPIPDAKLSELSIEDHWYF